MGRPSQHGQRIPPDHISAFVEALTADRGALVAYSGVLHTSANHGDEGTPLKDPFDPVRLRCQNYIPIHAMVFARTLLDKGCRFDESVEVYEDWEYRRERLLGFLVEFDCHGLPAPDIPNPCPDIDSMQSKITNLQALRGVAVLLVLFLHWRNVEQFYRNDGILPDWARIGHFGVDLFFVISGFIMMVIARNYPSDLSTAGTFLYHRWARIYPIYWFWFLISLAFYVLVPSWLRLEAGQLPYLINSFFLLPTWSAQLVPVSWTLKYELYFYLVFSTIILLPARWRSVALLSWGSYMLVGQALCYEAPHIRCNMNLFLTVHPLGFEFLFGALIGWIYLRRRAVPSVTLTLAGGGLVTAGLAIYISYGLELDDNIWYRVLLFGLPAAVLLYGCVELERQRELTAPRWLINIGNASYSIYISHLLLLNLLFGRLAEYLALPTLLLDTVVLVLTLGIGILGYQWVERPLLRLCRGQYRILRNKY